MGTRTSSLCAAVLTAFAAAPANGQAIDRPADERPALGQFAPEAPPEPTLRLPPPRPGADRLSAGLSVDVREIRVAGSSAFTPAELDRVTADWTGRALDAAEIQDLVDAVTSLYIQHGYVSSGATLPDQDLEGGVLVIRIVEARLADVVVEGNRWYRSGVLRSRLRAAVSTPVDVHAIEEQLQLLLQEPGIGRLSGELRPGPRRGEDVLVLTVEEARPFTLRLGASNDEPPSVGSVRGRIEAIHWSLLGFADRLEGRFDLSEGLDSQDIRYAFPFTPQATTLDLRWRRTHSEIVESPFDEANIESDTWTVGVGLRHPLVRTPRQQWWVGVSGERRRSTTSLDGFRFSFVPGPDNGRSDISVLRFVQDWIWRSPRNVIAARSTLNWGLDVLGATDNSGDVPDSEFVSWLAQVQWAHRFPEKLLGMQIVARADLQLASDSLLTLEQIGVGGSRTVRGYRENLLVRDNAVVGSVELRVPLFREILGGDVLQVAAFFDIGHAWNHQETLGRKTIDSAGVGLRYALADWIEANAYWGYAFRDFGTRDDNIQDNGFHLEVTFRAF